MATKILITGSTGYIGGSVLSTLTTTHPEYAITALLRSAPTPAYTAQYPNVSIIQGTYDDAAILTAAAAQSNVVIHCGNSDHEPSIKALIAGLLARSTPSFLIHLGGTGIVSDWQTGPYGALTPKIWSDVHDLDAIWSLPDDALHRNVDRIIEAAAAQHGEKLRTAIVCPPDIYGRGRGVARAQSVYVPFLVDECRKLGHAFYVGEGANARSWVHVDDLMAVYLRLVEAAARGGEGAEWGRDGYYFAASQETSQLDVSRAAGKLLKAKGLIAHEEPRQLSVEQVDGMMASWGVPHIGLYMFASNSRTRADRARKVLGYEPKAPTLLETLEEDVDAAIESLKM